MRAGDFYQPPSVIGIGGLHLGDRVDVGEFEETRVNVTQYLMK
jgi:hypothetical protein